MTTIHKGECFCGAVQVEVSGEPETMAYCHCNSCRSWSGSPVHASTMWKADSVSVIAGAEHMRTFHKTPQSISPEDSNAHCFQIFHIGKNLGSIVCLLQLSELLVFVLA